MVLITVIASVLAGVAIDVAQGSERERTATRTLEQTIPTAPTGRYIVTAAPLNVGARVPLCLAVEPDNPKGVWWWEPVDLDCSRRSTGPGVFPGENARVATSTTTPGAVTASFRLQLITANNGSSPPYKDVIVAVSSVAIRVEGSAVTVKTTRRGDLDIPER